MAGTRDGVLAHTVSGSSWWRLRFNGVEVGETGINAALCGAWGCPVRARHRRRGRLSRGAGAARRRASRPSRSRRASAGSAPASSPRPQARELIEDSAARRARGPRVRCEPYDPGSPCEILVDFNTSDHVERYRYRAGVEITGSRQISSHADDWWTAWRQFFF